MRNDRLESGLTLIEILIALIVLVIGLVGVLALFPTAIRSTNESVEDRMASVVAESVADALVVAMRLAPTYAVTLYHDGLSNSGYQFTLPLPADPPPGGLRFFAYPDGSGPDPAGVFMLGSDVYLKGVFADVVSGPDKTDSYTQYGFTFKVARMDDNRPVEETMDNYTPLPFYEFRIAVYRNPKTSTLSGGGGGSYWLTPVTPRPIKVYVIQVAGLYNEK